MELGFVGLGRMGGNMVRRLSKAGHRCHIHSSSAETRSALASETGAVAHPDLASLVAALAPPRVVWVMVPEGRATDAVVTELGRLCAPGDIVVDGGNSHFKQTVARGKALASAGAELVDCGTSGGVFGLTRGYSLMLGGSPAAIAQLRPLLDDLAPGIAAAPRTPARDGGDPAAGELGWLHCGKSGAGHYVKMIHNGVEYGMMQAMAEGFALFASAKGEVVSEDYRYDFDLAAIAEVWRRGSVVSSWLLDLGADALAANPTLDRYSPQVADSGEGRWTIEAAIDQRSPANVLAVALFARFASRSEDETANRFLSALRHQFGGHPGLAGKG
jgi:6-phosphogluconate dehydrogenase